MKEETALFSRAKDAENNGWTNHEQAIILINFDR